jgi:hypothetical protein
MLLTDEELASDGVLLVVVFVLVLVLVLVEVDMMRRFQIMCEKDNGVVTREDDNILDRARFLAAMLSAHVLADCEHKQVLE